MPNVVREVLGPYICKSGTSRTPRRVEDKLEGREMTERSDKMDEMKGSIDIQQTGGNCEQNEKWSVENGEERVNERKEVRKGSGGTCHSRKSIVKSWG